MKLFKKRKNIDVNKTRNLPYDVRYQRTGIWNIIKNIEKIENEVIEDILLSITHLLQKGNAIIKGELFELNGIQCKIYLSFEKVHRVLFIKIYPIIPRKKAPITVSTEINSFGAIKTITYEYPDELKNYFTAYYETIINQVKYAYLAIEKVFKTNFKSFGDYLFNQLYDILNLELERASKNKLIGKCAFEVTLRAKNKFRFFLEMEKLQDTIDYFKANQIPEFSPFQLITAIMSEEAIHTINSLMDIEEGKSNFLEAKYFKSKEFNYKFWKGEALLIKYKSISTYAVFKDDMVIFQIACPLELEVEFLPIFDNVKESLKEQFKSNISKYILHAKELSKIPKPIVPDNKSQGVAEFIGTVLGRGFAEFIESMAEH